MSDRRRILPFAAGADPLAELLAGRVRDPDDGSVVPAPDTRIAVADDLAGSEAGLVADLGLGRRLALVMDRRTEEALGARVERALRGRFRLRPLRLDDPVEADLETVLRLQAEAAACDALIAVGSGTVNDLVKMTAARMGRPWAVFGTAPSMNGYVSANAAIRVDGHKRSLAAIPPRGAFFDIEILRRAPLRLRQAGLGDSICRSTAQADWLLSHLLWDTPYRRLPFALLAADEEPLLARAAGIARGDREAIRLLTRTLLLSGFGMTIVGSSAPASQGEHLVSHYLEMMAPAGRRLPFHGEQIAVATLAVARIQDAMLAGPPPEIAPDPIDEAALVGHFGPELGAACWRLFRRKRLEGARLETVRRRVAEGWSGIRRRIASIRLPRARIEAVLREADLPLRAEELGIERKLWYAALLHAREIRDRFGFLDLAAASARLASLAAMEAGAAEGDG